MNCRFLDALHCNNISGTPPVWLMRQAGRYMPEYKKLRERYSLHQLFHTPKLAAEVTLQPIQRLGVDAAIIFTDILVVLEVLGLKVEFPEGGRGPYINCSQEEIVHLQVGSSAKVLSYLQDTIELVKPRLSVPLIGFCGGPYTVASYLIGRDKIENWVQKNRQALHVLLEKITECSISSLEMQVKAGVDVVQIFDSWAGLLPFPLFKELSLPYLQRIRDAISVPVILFTRGSSSYVEELSSIRPHAISFDGGKTMAFLRSQTPSYIAVQGNLEPSVLLEAKEIVEKKTKDILRSMQGEKGFIMNLGHGVLSTTPVENVEAFVSVVQNFTTSQ